MELQLCGLQLSFCFKRSPPQFCKKKKKIVSEPPTNKCLQNLMCIAMSALLWEENVLFSIEVQNELEKVMSATIWKSLCQIKLAF